MKIYNMVSLCLLLIINQLQAQEAFPIIVDNSNQHLIATVESTPIRPFQYSISFTEHNQAMSSYLITITPNPYTEKEQEAFKKGLLDATGTVQSNYVLISKDIYHTIEIIDKQELQILKQCQMQNQLNIYANYNSMLKGIGIGLSIAASAYIYLHAKQTK